MDSEWTEIVVKAPAGALERAEAALHMATPLGLYIEDFSDIESAAAFAAGVDYIEGDLLRMDRETALIHVYYPPGADRAECAAEIRRRMAVAGFAESGAGSAKGGAGAGFADGGAGAAIGGEKAPRFEIVSAGGVAEEDWANNWKQYFRPLRIGKGILIKPEWESADLYGEDLLGGVKAIISIDPGMAFGTGGHASTRMCLELIERYFETARNGGGNGNSKGINGDGVNANWARKTADVLDLGCGSGILSIAAVMLGARSALGVDIDMYAVRNASENAERNGVAGKTLFVAGDLLNGIKERYDLILANIVAGVVIRLLGEAGRCLAPGGAMIVSGIIDEREAEVIKAAGECGFVIGEIRRSEGWTALSLALDE